MSRDISVFDAGEYIGKLAISDSDTDNDNDNKVMALFKGFIDGKHIDVLYALDMDYGIVIPEHVANTIYGLV